MADELSALRLNVICWPNSYDAELPVTVMPLCREKREKERESREAMIARFMSSPVTRHSSRAQISQQRRERERTEQGSNEHDSCDETRVYVVLDGQDRRDHRRGHRGLDD